jgi:uncharacterized membrane protein YqiK
MNQLALTPTASAAAAKAAIQVEVRNLTVTGPDVQALLSAVATDIAVAPAMEIDSEDMAVEMQEILGRLSTVAAAIEAERKERGQPLRDCLQWLMDGYSPAHQMVSSIILEGKVKLSAWNQLKREAARRAAEEAERARREEAARRAAEEAAALAAAQEAAAAAVAAREAGSEQVAQAMEAQAMAAADLARQNAAAAAAAVFAAPVRPAAAGVKGASIAWKGECVDKVKLISHIAERIKAGDLSLISLVEIDAKAVNAMAKLQQANLNVPGLRSYTEERMRVAKVAVAA